MNTSKQNPAMPGVFNFEHAPELPTCAAAVHLATIAAPFAAAGRSGDEAVRSAYSLLLQCGSFLQGIQTKEIFRNPALNLSLKTVCQRLECSEKSLKSYLDAVRPDDARTIWTGARRGERVFTHDLWSKLIDERDRRYRDRFKSSAVKKAVKG